MRTTVNIDDDVLATARAMARSRNVSIGAVLSELARRGLVLPTRFVLRNGFPVFDVAPDAPVFDTETVLAHRDDP